MELCSNYVLLKLHLEINSCARCSSHDFIYGKLNVLLMLKRDKRVISVCPRYQRFILPLFYYTARVMRCTCPKHKSADFLWNLYFHTSLILSSGIPDSFWVDGFEQSTTLLLWNWHEGEDIHSFPTNKLLNEWHWFPIFTLAYQGKVDLECVTVIMGWTFEW